MGACRRLQPSPRYPSSTRWPTRSTYRQTRSSGAPAAHAPLEESGAAQVSAGRTAVLAIGSNAAPSQLNRKFAAAPFRGDDAEGTIPVVRARALDLDVVYGALVARYGSIPATALHAPGTEACVFVTWLTDRQLETLHASEGLGRWYRLARAERVRSAGRDLGPVAYYEAIAGPLRLSGVPVGLAAVRCPGSGLARLTQFGLWSALARSLATGLDGRALVDSVRRDPDRRAALEEALRAGMAAPTHDGAG